MNRTSYFAIGCAATLLLLITAIIADAHSFPIKQTPAAGAELETPPARIAIRFDAPIEQLFARIVVTGPGGASVPAGAPHVSSDGYTLTTSLPPLMPGDYTVKWAVVCIDTHHTNGSYEFTVAPKTS